jgi:hypothetical protein
VSQIVVFTIPSGNQRVWSVMFGEGRFRSDSHESVTLQNHPWAVFSYPQIPGNGSLLR